LHIVGTGRPCPQGENRTLAKAPPAGDSGPAVSAEEAFEIITWYHLFISVKLARALHRDAFDEEIENDPELADMPREWRSSWPDVRDTADTAGTHLSVLEEDAATTAKVIRGWIDALA
jgi:hypothetical protein